MRKALLIVGLVACGCGSKHNEPGYTSLAGEWTYTTPDSKIAVNFDLVASGSTLSLQNQTFKLDGTDYQSAAELGGATLTQIASLRINANDAKAVFPFSIELDSCHSTDNYKTMAATKGSYTWPWGTTINLSNVTVSRR